MSSLDDDVSAAERAANLGQLPPPPPSLPLHTSVQLGKFYWCKIITGLEMTCSILITLNIKSMNTSSSFTWHWIGSQWNLILILIILNLRLLIFSYFLCYFLCYFPVPMTGRSRPPRCMQVSFAPHPSLIQMIHGVQLKTALKDPAVCFPSASLPGLEVPKQVTNSNSCWISATVCEAFTEECKSQWTSLSGGAAGFNSLNSYWIPIKFHWCVWIYMQVKIFICGDLDVLHIYVCRIV